MPLCPNHVPPIYENEYKATTPPPPPQRSGTTHSNTYDTAQHQLSVMIVVLSGSDDRASILLKTKVSQLRATFG